MRTAFFGGVNKRDEPFKIDEFELDYSDKELPKNCRHVRNCYVEILKFTEELEVLDETNYIEWKKNKITNKYKDIIKFFKEHIRKERGHAVTKRFILQVLEPLVELMGTGYRLICFELQHPGETLV